MPDGRGPCRRRASRPSSRRVGVEGACPRLGLDRPVLGGGVRHRQGGAVADEAEGVIRNSEFGIRNYPSFARGRAAEPLHLMKKQYIKYKNI